LAPRKIAQKENHWSSTREFFAECPAPIIGVTGTKGKGSTCSFITEILRAAGKTVHLVGNIGVASLDILPKIKESDYVVYELSSFQLWDIERSPHVAVMTLIEMDHQDVHENYAEYVEAKSHIFAFQRAGDAAVYNARDALVREMAETTVTKTGATPKPFLNKKFAHIKQGKFYYNDTEICATSVVKLPGEHNLRNAAAAITAVWDLLVYNTTITTDKSSSERSGDLLAVTKAIEAGLANFHGLPHRLKFVREVEGVKYYDDSIATTPGSAIAAVKSFDEPKILIIGGHDKGADYYELGEAIERSNVRKIFAIGANREKVAQQLSEKTATPIHVLDNQNLAEIVGIVNQETEPGDVVIMSPAAASFDMFRDYKDRGEQFITVVENLAK
jgi:UDP-N-acetylmuramoylalanine--D-glutamate ligase